MKRTTLIILGLSLFLVLLSSFVIWDLYFKDKSTVVLNSPIENSGIQPNTTLNKQTSKDRTKTDTQVKTSQKADYLSVEEFTKQNLGFPIVGRPTDKSIAVNIIASKGMSAYVEYGTSSGNYSFKSEMIISKEGEPILIELDNLSPNAKYYYRVNYKTTSQGTSVTGKEYFFQTARAVGSTFTFGVQGDSHPERPGKMFNSELYKVTMANALSGNPDFYFTVGDDFSIERLIEQNTFNEETVDRVYLNQRNYLGIIGNSVPLFLVDGNHEQAAKYLLDGTNYNPAILAANSRIKNYPLPVPDGFYSGDEEQIEFVGLLRDYYAFTWGDALFVTIDPYWHSDVPVDNVAGNDGEKRKDLWDITLGEKQYQWFKETLENSDAKYKFVFTHHVLGTGRGGIENAKLYEWGGYSGNGVYEFNTKRPNWEKPIHQLMVDNGVSIFFQGHDHLFAYQELDGIVYQSLPNPADDTYTAFNEDAYNSGETLPNSGYLKITVSPEKVNVDYINSFLPGDGTNGQIAYSYEVLP